MAKTGKFLNLWLPVAFWGGLIFYLSSIPNLKTAQNPFWDEIIRSGAHFIFYALGYFLFFRALNFAKKEKNFILPLVLVFLYGLSDEIHQSFVPTRTFQVKDLIVNLAGAFLSKNLTSKFNFAKLRLMFPKLKKLTIFGFIFLLAFLLPWSARAVSLREGDFPKDKYLADEIIVKFKGDVEPFRVIKVPEGRVGEKIKEYLARRDIVYAEPNYIAYALMIPNDPYYKYQWHLDNPVYGGIQMEEAWDVSTGSSSVVVAIVDTGIAYENYGKYCQASDLANTSFIAGYDFVNNDSQPNDDNRHGTHVTGTVAQSTNNNLGVAGVAFNTSLMPIKVLDSRGSGTYANVAKGIRHAANNGAKVINLSLGGSSDSTTLKDAVAYAHGKGVTVIAACGNDNKNICLYPAAYDDYVIAVGATQYDETKAPYSNYGPSLDLVAPGGNNSLDQNNDGYADGVLQQTFKNSYYVCNFAYYFFQGTSMATPHVSGVAALLIAKGNATTPDDIRTALQSTAEDKGAIGRDDTYGWGLVNAYAALQWTAVPPTPDTTPPLISGVATTNITSISATVTWITDEPSNSVVNYGPTSALGSTASDAAMVTNHSINLTGLGKNTTYYYEVKSTDASGNTATDNNNGLYYTFTTLANQSPLANAGPDKSAYVGETVNFDGSGSYDPDGTIVSYAWDFGDGTTGTGVATSHAYSATGIYTVTLIVTDNGGLTSLDTALVTISTVPVGPTMHVGNITFTSSTRTKNTTLYCRVVATVPILDASNVGVKEAMIYGSWSGVYTASVSKATNGEGLASFRTDWVAGCGTFTFTVNNVVKTDWIYDPAANVETSDSITLP